MAQQLSEETKEFFRRIGQKGGKKRAKKYSAKQLREWGKLGGRPAEPKKEPENK